MSTYALYRNTTLGIALEQALQDLNCEDISKQMEAKIMGQFDKCMNKAIMKIANEKMHFRAGKLVTYRYCDNVWTFILDDVEIRDPHRSFDHPLNRLKIVACDGRPAHMLHQGPLGAGSSKKHEEDDED